MLELKLTVDSDKLIFLSQKVMFQAFHKYIILQNN